MNARIVERSIQKLKAPERGNRITWDTSLPGFGVRVTKAGSTAFVLDYYFNGRKRRITIGQHPVWNATTARAKAQELKAQIANGADPLEEKDRDRKAPTMKTLGDQYLEEHASKNKRAGSIRNDRGILSNIIWPRLGQLRVKSITPRDVESLHRSLKATPYHANRVLSLLSKMFTLAVKWGYRSDNPVKGVERYPEHTKERWLSAEELQRFSAALDEYADQNAADALRMLLFTGCREMEALSCDWSQLDLQRAVWTKPSHRTKENKTEHIPLNDSAIALLAKMHAQRNGCSYLFPGNKTDSHRVTLAKVFRQVCKAAGLAEARIVAGKRKQLTRYRSTFRIHDLRHSFASHLVSNGVSLETVGKLMGHTRPETTSRYAHHASEALRDASNVFVKVLANGGAK